MGTDYAAVARLLGNPQRSAMVDRLMDGVALTAGELARAAGVRPSTASEHLSELTHGGLVDVVRQGRHRYYSIADGDVAQALEALAQICPPTRVQSLDESRARARMRTFRTCYDHLAGRVAVAMLDAMLRERWLTSSYDLTARGRDALEKIGLDLEVAQGSRRPLARACADWTERRPHLAGSLGKALADLWLARGWARRHSGGRGLTLTDRGATALRDHFDVELP